jgi:ADP-ribose pyrophosphatase YjhB (NUDIX family)
MTDPSRFIFCPYDGEKLIANRKIQKGHRFCRSCGFVDYQNPKACVAVLILQGDKILLARRGVEPAKGEWDIPGGFVEAKESAEKAVFRETLEETRLRVRVREYLGSLPDVYHPRCSPTLNLCYWVEIVHGIPTAKSDVDALKWFRLDNLPKKLAFAHQAQAIEILRKRLKS